MAILNWLCAAIVGFTFILYPYTVHTSACLEVDRMVLDSIWREMIRVLTVYSVRRFARAFSCMELATLSSSAHYRATSGQISVALVVDVNNISHIALVCGL